MSTAEASLLTYVHVDVRGGCVTAAANFESVVGFRLGPPPACELQQALQVLRERVRPADLRRVERALHRLAPGRTASAQQFSVRDNAGRERQIDSIWAVEFDAERHPFAIVVACSDVTARLAAAEEALRESQTRYRCALNAGRMGSWETDLIERTRLWSPEGMALFGLTLPGGCGRVAGDDDEHLAAVHPQDRDQIERLHRLADVQDSFAAEYRIVRPDGRTLWLSGREVVVSRTPDGRARRLVSIMADITERKQAEMKLQVERERLGLALRAGQMGAYDLDIMHNHLWWSPQTFEVLGVDARTFTPDVYNVVALVHPDDREAFVQRRAEAIKQRKPLFSEFRVLRPDGSEGWISQRGQAEYGPDGRATRSFGVVLDITERKLAEQALHDADAKKDNFVATLAHELRNPLAPIRNAIEVLRTIPEADAKVAWCRDVIDRQVDQMAHLLDDLLDASRITRNEFRLRTKRLTMSTVIENAIEIAQPVIDACGHDLAVVVLDETLSLDGDLTRLAQVFSNLLINAAKYTPRGGRIGLTVRPHDAEIVTMVWDTGIGIPHERQAQLFEMFGQMSAAPEGPQSGLGIGLWLARRLVELHGGRIVANSAGRGLGSEFVVHLPRAHAVDDADAPAVGGARGMPSKPRRILVADDLRDSADSLDMLLSLLGHEVRVAYDGEQALELAEQWHPDVALLDIGMPKLDGHEVCRRIRAQPWGARMMLIAQTGWGSEEDRRRTRDAGFDHHVVKPIDPSVLTVLL